MKNSYLGLPLVLSNALVEYREKANEFARKAGEISFEESLKDRGEFHITVINPQEFKQIKLSQQEILKLAQEVTTDDLIFEGLGRAYSLSQKDVAYFIVCTWPSADHFRQKLNLPSYEYHLTLGFKEKDVFPHTAFPKNYSGKKSLKGKKSIIVPHSKIF